MAKENTLKSSSAPVSSSSSANGEIDYNVNVDSLNLKCKQCNLADSLWKRFSQGNPY